MKRSVVYVLIHQNQKMQWINIKHLHSLLNSLQDTHTEDGKPQEISGVGCLLWAVGRDANIVDLGIDQTGVKLDRRGFIEVDEYQNTSMTNMYALGDVAGKKLLTPGEGVRV